MLLRPLRPPPLPNPGRVGRGGKNQLREEAETRQDENDLVVLSGVGSAHVLFVSIRRRRRRPSPPKPPNTVDRRGGGRVESKHLG